MCEHTPLSAADCNPNKVMRSTIRVFIKTELKKRETNRAKQTKDATQVAPATPVEAPAAAAETAAATAALVSGEPQVQSTATDGMAVATIAAGEAQQGQGQGTGSSSSYSSKPLDNAQSRAEDSQMQESGHAGARREDDAPADGAALTNGGNDLSADTADQTVRNSHFLRVLLMISATVSFSLWGQDDTKRKTVQCTFFENVQFANMS